jgi:hypothetical protein
VVAKAKPSELAFLLRVDDALKWEGTGQNEEVISRMTLPVDDIGIELGFVRVAATNGNNDAAFCL